MNDDYPWSLAAKCKSPIACVAHGAYGWCLEQDTGEHIPLTQLKKFCTCDFPLQTNTTCPVDQHRHDAALQAAIQARRDRYTRSPCLLSEAELKILHHERCVCGHIRFAHDRLWGRCLHDFGEMEACACQRFTPEVTMLFSLVEQLNVDVHW